MNADHPLLPPEWNALCHNIARQYGINTDASALLILQAYGVACSDTIKLRTPTAWICRRHSTAHLFQTAVLFHAEHLQP